MQDEVKATEEYDAIYNNLKPNTKPKARNHSSINPSPTITTDYAQPRFIANTPQILRGRASYPVLQKPASRTLSKRRSSNDLNNNFAFSFINMHKLLSIEYGSVDMVI